MSSACPEISRGLGPLARRRVDGFAATARGPAGAAARRAERCVCRRGMTMVELLVVVVLLMILMAAAMPRFRTGMEGKRVREAARLVNVGLGVARVRAIESRRSAGIVLHPAADGAYSISVEQTEMPPAYGGDDTSAKATVQQQGGVVTGAKLTSFNKDLVKPGDTIQFNYQGPWYNITDVSGGGVQVSGPDVSAWPAPYPVDVPYKIRRQWVRAPITPVQFPGGAVVDLSGSWVGDATHPMALAPPNPPMGDICIMFSPSGAIERVYAAGVPAQQQGSPFNKPFTGTISILIGKKENMGKAPDDPTNNVNDATNMRVVIQAQSGVIQTTEM
jgi:Tfp pilus assembly protein FimT